jgi:hypothetical protein
MAHVGNRARQQRTCGRDLGRGFRGTLADHRPEHDGVAFTGEAIEPGAPVEIDQHGRRRHAHVDQRHQALAAGEQARIAPGTGEKVEHLGDGLGRVVVERSRLHGYLTGIWNRL